MQAPPQRTEQEPVKYSDYEPDGVHHNKPAQPEQKLIGTVIENCILLGFAAIVVDEDVAHDGVEPSFDVGTYTVLLLIGECTEHGFLYQVFGRLMIFREGHSKRPEVFCITEQKLIEFLGRHVVLFKLLQIKFKQKPETAN